MHEGWLVDPGTNWVWRFHRDDKAWVRDPKVFMDRGMAMPDGQPPLLKERRHVPQEDAETIWRNLKSMGWKRSEPLWVPQQNPDHSGLICSAYDIDLGISHYFQVRRHGE